MSFPLAKPVEPGQTFCVPSAKHNAESLRYPPTTKPEFFTLPRRTRVFRRDQGMMCVLFRSKTKATHFTAKETREAVAAVRAKMNERDGFINSPFSTTDP
jgi:hypothetical protein